MPAWTTVAPYARSRATLTAGAVVGTNTVAGTPTTAAAYALASPALPPEATTIPTRASSSPDSRADRTRLNAPRALNVPVCWSSSSLNQAAPASTSTTGVTRTRPAIRAAAASTSSRVITCRSSHSGRRAFRSGRRERREHGHQPRARVRTGRQGLALPPDHRAHGHGVPSLLVVPSGLSYDDHARIRRNGAQSLPGRAAAQRFAWGRAAVRAAAAVGQ